MSKQPFARTALAAALVALGFGAHAENTARTTADSAQKPAASQRAAANGDTRAATSGSTQGDAIPRSERKFMEKAAAHGRAEVELGRLAQDRARSEEVKKFAERMVRDHGKANEELERIAAAKGVQLPAAPDKDHRKKMEKLGRLSGQEFDRAYMKEMTKDHKSDLGDFRKQAKSAKDPQVKAFAAKTLPTLEEHHKLAQATQASVGARARTAQAPTQAPEKERTASAEGDRVAARSGGAPGTGRSPATGGSGLK